MLQQNNEVIRSLLTKWSASATSDQTTVLVLVTIISLQSLFQTWPRHGSSHAQGTGQPAQHYWGGIVLCFRGCPSVLKQLLVTSLLFQSWFLLVTSSLFQRWWVFFTCRILLRRTLWRISAAVCTSPLPSRIISRWNEDALRTAYKMKPPGRDSLGHSAPAARASTKVSPKIQLLVAFHYILNSYPRPCPRPSYTEILWSGPLNGLHVSPSCLTCTRSEWAIAAFVDLFSNSLSRPNLYHWTHLLRSSSTCSIRPKIALTLASPGALPTFTSSLVTVYISSFGSSQMPALSPAERQFVSQLIGGQVELVWHFQSSIPANTKNCEH